MAKCIRCEKSFFGHGKIKLADAEICFKCYDELGFDHKTGLNIGSLYKWNDIKDGYEAMRAKENAKRLETEAEKLGLTVKLYNHLRKAEATDPEIRLMSAMCALLTDEGRDLDALNVALGDNGSLNVMINGDAIIQYKSDSGVKWIRFPHESNEKLRITGPASLNKLASRIVSAYDSIQ